MLNIDKSKELFNKIYGDENLTEILAEYTAKHKRVLGFYTFLGGKRNWLPTLKRNPFFKLCVAFAFLPETKKRYDEKGISEKIFFDTMDDLRIWIDDYFEHAGEYGLDEFNWLFLHFNLDIFKLGRLQFQKSKYFSASSYRKNGLEIKPGGKVLFLHIPRGEPLDIGECRKSLKLAESFFEEYYPDYRTDCYACDSWLLYPGNENYMSRDGNILKFASYFDIISERENPGQPYRWLFGVKVSSAKLIKNRKTDGNYGDTSHLPGEKELQRRAIAYINGGGILGDAKGVVRSFDDE